jgi:hypothetical protein
VLVRGFIVSGKRHKQKGDRAERAVRDAHTAHGIPCQRVPLSGAVAGFGGDLSIFKGQFKGEVKSRRNAAGWRQVRDWLGINDFLFLREDGGDTCVVMKLDQYLRLLAHSLTS